MPKNEGLDEWYLVDPKSSGAATGCKFEQEHRETGCNESHTQEQKAVVNWQNSDLSCPSFFTCRTELKLEPFFQLESKTVVRFFHDAESECI